MFAGEFLCIFAFWTISCIEKIRQRAKKHPADKPLLSSSHIEEEDVPTATLHGSINDEETKIVNYEEEHDEASQTLLASQGNNFTSYSSTTNEPVDTTTVAAVPVIPSKPPAVPEKPDAPFILFALPAICDLSATTLQNVGLIYTSVSVFQMLRGTVVILNGILSMVFLKNRLYPHNFLGLMLIATGIAIVGLSSVLNANPNDLSMRNPLLGNICVLLGQGLAASQYIAEEFILSRYKAKPLQVVGYEGYFGLCMTTILMFILYWIPWYDYNSLESFPYALAQCFNSERLLLITLASIVSISFFNFFGISITQRLTSTARSTIDASRTVIIWIISLSFGWESFKWLQLLGFIVLISGSFTYNSVIINSIIPIPWYTKWYQKNRAEWMKRRKEKEMAKLAQRQKST